MARYDGRLDKVRRIVDVLELAADLSMERPRPVKVDVAERIEVALNEAWEALYELEREDAGTVRKG